MPLQCQTPVTSSRASWLCGAWGDVLLTLHGWVHPAQSCRCYLGPQRRCWCFAREAGRDGGFSRARQRAAEARLQVKGNKWPSGGWENRGLGRLRDVHQDSAKNRLCCPLAWAGAPLPGWILVKGSPQPRRAFCSSCPPVFVSHPGLAGRCLGAVSQGGPCLQPPQAGASDCRRVLTHSLASELPLPRGFLGAGQGDGIIQMQA